MVCNCFMSWDWLAFSSYQSFNGLGGRQNSNITTLQFHKNNRKDLNEKCFLKNSHRSKSAFTSYPFPASFILFTFLKRMKGKCHISIRLEEILCFSTLASFQRCLFQVGSYSFNDQKMIFLESPRVKGYVETSRSIVLDYDVKINQLKQSDRMLNYGSLGNYSLAGFETILHRYVSHYIITYYLPSGRRTKLFFFKSSSMNGYTFVVYTVVFMTVVKTTMLKKTDHSG